MRLDAPAKLLLLVLGTMFVQQTFASIGRNLPPVIAPAIMEDLQLDPAWLGVYVGVSAGAALLTQLGCGSFIVRHGALRMSQMSLVFLALGLAAAAAGPLAFFALSAIVTGCGGALSTPASSHLLGRFSTPRQAPLVFSIKQTAVPTGLLLSGILGPPMVVTIGWRGAMLVAALGCLVFAIVMQPLRARLDDDRVPSRMFRLGDFAATVKVAMRGPELRNLSVACFAFNGLQAVFIAYFVTWLAALGHGLVTAGLVFSVTTLIAVPGRILWGWLAGARFPPGLLLGWLAMGMSAAAAVLAFSGPDWPLLVIGALATVLSATVLSWHGVLLAEAARLAPDGLRAQATGGVLSFGQVGALLLPLIYSGTLALTGKHGLGFALSTVPAFIVGVLLLRRKPSAE
jgi:MFS family permease